MIVGVIGGGQLGRMMGLAGLNIGARFVFLDPDPDACARDVGEHLCAGFEDAHALGELAGRADVLTFDFENVPESSLESLQERVRVAPSARALGVSQDRRREKELFRELGIPTAEFCLVDTIDGLAPAIDAVGLPAVLKTRRLGYDGKGQAVIRSHEEAAAAWEAIGGVPAILEAFVEFTREVSVIAARGRDGHTAIYPLCENVHRDGILRTTRPRPGDPATASAGEMISRLLDALDYVGVLTLELFDTCGGLVANEFAPRVHNSGHWTIEGAQTSQFENHIRAIADLPLGETSAVETCAMLNIVGAIPPAQDVLAVPGAHLHLYGKTPRPGRKVGHITIRSTNAEEVEQAVAALSALEGVG